jgi:hypothetical protein
MQPGATQPVVPGSNSAVSFQESSETKPAEAVKTVSPEGSTEAKSSTPPMNFRLPE